MINFTVKYINMNFLFWKHKSNGEVITNDCKSKLPTKHQEHFVKTTQRPTHQIVDSSDDDFTTAIIAAEVLSGLFTDNSDYSTDHSDYGSSSDSDFSFGGGDSGGGGTSGDW